MVATVNPDIFERAPGKRLKKLYHNEGVPRFSGYKERKNKNNYTNTQKLYTNNTDPLRATRNKNMVAFKGSVASAAKDAGKTIKNAINNKTKDSGFIKDFFESFKEKAPKKAEELIAEIRQILPKRKNNGLDSLINTFETSGEGANKGFLLKETVEMGETPLDGAKSALKGSFTWIGDWFRRITKGKLYKAQLKKDKEISANKKNLLGFYKVLTTNGEHFDDAFSGKNLAEIKKMLKKGDSAKDTLKQFLKDKKIKTEYLVDENEDWFKSLKKNLVDNKDNGEGSYLAAQKTNYLARLTNGKENDKAGSPSAKFGSELGRFINKSVSGTTTAWFIGQDFYNLHIMAKDDPKGAKEERNRRFVQQMSYVGLTAYFDYLTGATFKALSNKYLGFAVGLGVLTSLAANSASRIINGVPLLPHKPKEMQKKPYVITASPLKENGFKGSENSHDTTSEDYASLNTYNQLRNKSAISGSLAFKGVNVNQAAKAAKSSNISSFFNKISKMNGKIKSSWRKLLPEKVKYEDFEEGYNILRKVDPERAKILLKIAADHTPNIDKTAKDQQVTLEHIKKASKDGKVIVGANSFSRMGESFVKGVVYPFIFVKDIGKGLVNLVRKVFKKPEIQTKEESRFIPAVAAKNLINWSKKAKEASGYKGDISKAPDNTIEDIRLLFGKNFSGTHNPNIMSYGSDQLSTWMKPIGFVSVPFLAIDAYNVTARETNNENISNEKAKQRAVQDSTRQAISFWAVKSFNEVFKDLANHSPLGNALATFLNNAGYEAATRTIVGQPILSKSHEEMKEIEKRRLRNPSWLSKVLVKQRVRTTEDDKVILGSNRLLRENEGSFVVQPVNTFNPDYTGFKNNTGIVKGFFN